MKTLALTTAIVIAISLQSHGQLKGFSIGPYAEMIWPTGSAAKEYNSGVGAGLNADIRVRKIGITGSAGYIHFSARTVITNEGSIKSNPVNAIPIRVGVKYRFVPALYVKLEGGMAKFTDGTHTATIISPGIGLRLLGLDVQGKYETWIHEGSGWGVRVAYNF